VAHRDPRRPDRGLRVHHRGRPRRGPGPDQRSRQTTPPACRDVTARSPAATPGAYVDSARGRRRAQRGRPNGTPRGRPPSQPRPARHSRPPARHS
jgi:hypothetical protein